MSFVARLARFAMIVNSEVDVLIDDDDELDDVHRVHQSSLHPSNEKLQSDKHKIISSVRSLNNNNAN